jgi:hypothetical protein
MTARRLSLEDHMHRRRRSYTPGVPPLFGGQEGQFIFKLRIDAILQFDLAVYQIPLNALEFGMQVLLFGQIALPLLLAYLLNQLVLGQLHLRPHIPSPSLLLPRLAFLLGQAETDIRRGRIGIMDAMVELPRLAPDVHILQRSVELLQAGLLSRVGGGGPPEGSIHGASRGRTVRWWRMVTLCGILGRVGGER